MRIVHRKRGNTAHREGYDSPERLAARRVKNKDSDNLFVCILAEKSFFLFVQDSPDKWALDAKNVAIRQAILR